MKNLTIENIKEIHLLILGMKNILLESVEGAAKVAKAIQLYLGCEFKEAVVVLGEFVCEGLI